MFKSQTTIFLSVASVNEAEKYAIVFNSYWMKRGPIFMRGFSLEIEFICVRCGFS